MTPRCPKRVYKAIMEKIKKGEELSKEEKEWRKKLVESPKSFMPEEKLENERKG